MLDESPLGAGSTENACLDVLLFDYEQARNDQRELENTQATILGILLASFVGVLAVMASEKSAELDEWVFALLPLIVYVPTTFAVWIGNRAAQRSFYVRVLEREIRNELESVSQRDKPTVFKNYSGLQIVSLEDLLLTKSSMARGFSAGAFTMTTMVVSYVVALGFLLFQVYSKLQPIGPWGAGVVIGIYLAISLVLGGSVLAENVRGRKSFENAIERYSKFVSEDLLPRTGQRRRYSVLLPRPDDLGKIGLGLVGVLIGALTIGWNWPTFLVSAICVVVFDVVFYQTRYILNDLHGFDEDRNAPNSSGRSRIGNIADFTRASNWLLIRFVFLLFISVGMFCKLPQIGVPVASASIMTIVLTVIYENARAREITKSRTIGRLPTTMVFITVTLGYVLRSWLGLWLYAATSTRPPTRHSVVSTFVETLNMDFGIGWVLAGWSAGCGLIFVTLTWVLECLQWLQKVEGSEVQMSEGAVGKPHVFWSGKVLLQQLGLHCRLSSSTTQADSGAEGSSVLAASVDKRSPVELAKTADRPQYSNLFQFINQIIAWLFSPWAVGSLVISSALGIWFSRVHLVGVFWGVFLCMGLWIVSLIYEAAILAESKATILTLSGVALLATVAATVVLIRSDLVNDVYLEHLVRDGAIIVLLYIGGVLPWIFFFLRHEYEEIQGVLKRIPSSVFELFSGALEKYRCWLLRWAARALGRGSDRTADSITVPE